MTAGGAAVAAAAGWCELYGSPANAAAWARGEPVVVEAAAVGDGPPGAARFDATLRNLSGGPLLLSGIGTACGSAACDALPLELPFPGRRRVRVLVRAAGGAPGDTGLVTFFTSRGGRSR